VGLKPFIVSANHRAKLGQQSHHCGIEKPLLVYVSAKIMFAAIAPLWD